VTIEDVEAARGRIAGSIVRTPLVRLNSDDSGAEVYLKLECLQPTGSFKVRGAGNAITQVLPEAQSKGVYTCSAGNMAQALAWHAHRAGVPCTVIVPDSAPRTKTEAIRRLGAKMIPLSWDEVWNVATTGEYAPLKESIFVHPFNDVAMMAGSGTIGLEILEDLPDVDAVVVPYGGGGLFVGIATAVKARKPSAKAYASEVATAAPLTAAMEAGGPRNIDRTPSFVDGIGAQNVLPEMWTRTRPLIDGAIVVPLEGVAAAIKLLVERNRVVAEGAAGSSVAAALTGRAGGGKVVCIVSGGNIDSSKLAKILEGGLP
jgi:threonine dehydratase